jgi:hypothetical protein
MVTAILNKFGESCTPSDEAGETSDDANAPNSGTSLASNFRKIRLQGHSSPIRDNESADAKEFIPRSPNGTVLARVQMFEAQNAKTISSPTHRASPRGNIKNESKPVTTVVSANKKVTNQSTAVNVTESRPIGSSLYRPKSAPVAQQLKTNSDEREKNRTRPSTSPGTMSAGGESTSDRETVDSRYIISNPTPEDQVSSSFEREKLSVAETVERAVDKAIAESRALREQRTMGGRRNTTEKHYSGVSRTALYAKDTSPLKHIRDSSSALMDPLDREAKKKQDSDVAPITNSLSRKKKFQMVEASMKKSLRKDKGARSIVTDSTSSISGSSVNSVGTDFTSEPGIISPKSPFGVDSKRSVDAMKFDQLDVLPTIHSNEDIRSPVKDFVVSSISLSSRRDPSRPDATMYSDINPMNIITNQNKFRSRDFDPSTTNVHSVDSPPLEVKRSSPIHRDVRQTDMLMQLHADSDSSRKTNTSAFESSPLHANYFGPITVDGAPSSSFNEDNDDDTQFNSVSMHDNHRKGASKESFFHQPSESRQNSPGFPKGSDAGSYFFDGNFRSFGEDFQEEAFTRQDVSNQKQADMRDQRINERDLYRDDDAESITDSVTNGSWTGRMRARKAMEQTISSDKMEQRNPRFTSNYINKEGVEYQDDNMSVANKVFNNVQKQQRAAMNDAQEGFNIFSAEDPKSTAIGLGVAGALCGAIVLGPMGMVLGAAGAGVGYKFSQMPEKERSEVKNKASSAMKKLRVSAMAANDTISNSCATACGNPQTDEVDTGATNNPMHLPSRSPHPVPSSVVDRTSLISPRGDDNPLGMKLKVSNVHIKPKDIVPSPTEQNAIQPSRARQMRRMTPACRRVGRITPVGQIHSLDPALHPRAWLDVMASAWTSRDEKNEAMEEILLLAKDKVSEVYPLLIMSFTKRKLKLFPLPHFQSHSRMLLDEGILDSLMFILRAFFLNYADIQRKNGEKTIPVETYMADPNFYHAKLASNCCVALAKAHCAMAHTTGEEMIASNAHMTVPLTKQVAQMLYDVPHHMVLNTEKDGEREEVFKLTTEMSVEQAENLASSILSLSMGKIDIGLQEM